MPDMDKETLNKLYYGHGDGVVVTQDKDGFHERPMTQAELAAREPAAKIQDDIHRLANYAGICYVEIWDIIADAISGALPQWHPIETAPKDNKEPIIIACSNYPGIDGPLSAPGFYVPPLGDSPDEMGHDGGFMDVDHEAFVLPRSFGAEQYKRVGIQPDFWTCMPVFENVISTTETGG